jgi:hypothetical protein
MPTDVQTATDPVIDKIIEPLTYARTRSTPKLS